MFEFATASRIVFGRGKRTEIFAAMQSYGTRGLLVTGTNAERSSWITGGSGPTKLTLFSVAGEPSVTDAAHGRDLAIQSRVEFVIACGGGSVIDCGKAIAALVTNSRPVEDYLEVVGGAIPLTEEPLPFIAVPTTAGTGAEVTRNAVLFSASHQVKVSLRSPKMLPALAIVDPALTDDLPAHLTATTGMDALTQLIEPFLCNRANPVTDALCRAAIPRAAAVLPRAFENGSDSFARDEMSLASLFGGLALANAGLGAVHGFAAPIGGMFPAAHGAVCAALLAEVLEKNLEVLWKLSPGSSAIARFNELGALLTGRSRAQAAEAVSEVRALTATLGIQPLRKFGITSADVPEIARRAQNASSMKANPVLLSLEDLSNILARAL